MLKLQKGNPTSRNIVVTDSAGAAYNLTGLTIFFTVKTIDDTLDDDTGALITKTITVHTNAAGGLSTLSLSASDTDIEPGNYKYDIRIYKDTPLVQLNSMRDTCKVEDIITKRIV